MAIKCEIADGVLSITGTDRAYVFGFSLEDARKLRQFLNNHQQELRPEKDWVNCPYAGHSNDCECGGMGGDR